MEKELAFKKKTSILCDGLLYKLCQGLCVHLYSLKVLPCSENSEFQIMIAYVNHLTIPRRERV